MVVKCTTDGHKIHNITFTDHGPLHLSIYAYIMNYYYFNFKFFLINLYNFLCYNLFTFYYIKMIKNGCSIFVNVHHLTTYCIRWWIYYVAAWYFYYFINIVHKTKYVLGHWVLCKYLMKNVFACITVYLFIYLFTVIYFIYLMCIWKWNSRRINFSKKCVININTQNENLRFCQNSRPHHIVVLQIYTENYFYFMSMLWTEICKITIWFGTMLLSALSSYLILMRYFSTRYLLS